MFTPRLSKSGMLYNPFWYDSSKNFYYPKNGLPNCTCYALGRFYEETPNFPPPHINGDGGQWWEAAQELGLHIGQTPQLGAIICLGDTAGAGHVGIVEQMFDDYIVCSNSAYYRAGLTPEQYYETRAYFFLTENYKNNNYVPSGWDTYYFQGFIYNDNIDIEPTIKNKTHYKWVLYSRMIRRKFFG